MELIIGGKYKHYKGNFYKVVGVAKHSETLEELVIYEVMHYNKEQIYNNFWGCLYDLDNRLLED